MEKLKQIAKWFQDFGITLYYVGGCVRDELMGNPVEDIDICVVGGHTAWKVASKLVSLKEFGHIQNCIAVHGSFPIWIVEIDGEKYEFAMARKERKIGQTRQEFDCEVNNVTIEEDLMRRDLTINAIAKNVVTGEIVDPFEGRKHIILKVAHPVSEAFKEDNLRVYRAARFIAKFNLRPSIDLLHFCTKLTPSNPVLLSNERVGMELMKMLKTAKTPSKFFKFLNKVGWLQYHFPELYACIGVPQNPVHHPEGDVYTHIMHCIDAAEGWFYRAVMLCHDLGKATTTELSNDGNRIKWEDFNNQSSEGFKITAHGHEEAGVQLTKDMLKRIHFTKHDVIDQIACLVELHMIRTVLNEHNFNKIIRRTIRQLSKKELIYDDLVYVIFCDLAGRPPKKSPSIQELSSELYAQYGIDLEQGDEMTPVVTGKVLMELGMEPGTEMGEIISHSLELQDRGTLTKDNWQKVLKGAGYKFFQTKKETK